MAMSVASDDNILALINEFLAERTGTVTAHLNALGDETNLIESDILDSASFVELVLFLEEKTAVTIDLSNADTDTLATVRGLRQIFCDAAAIKND